MVFVVYRLWCSHISVCTPNSVRQHSVLGSFMLIKADIKLFAPHIDSLISEVD